MKCPYEKSQETYRMHFIYVLSDLFVHIAYSLSYLLFFLGGGGGSLISCVYYQ